MLLFAGNGLSSSFERACSHDSAAIDNTTDYGTYLHITSIIGTRKYSYATISVSTSSTTVTAQVL